MLLFCWDLEVKSLGYLFEYSLIFEMQTFIAIHFFLKMSLLYPNVLCFMFVLSFNHRNFWILPLIFSKDSLLTQNPIVQIMFLFTFYNFSCYWFEYFYDALIRQKDFIFVLQDYLWARIKSILKKLREVLRTCILNYWMKYSVNTCSAHLIFRIS